MVHHRVHNIPPLDPIPSHLAMQSIKKRNSTSYNRMQFTKTGISPMVKSNTAAERSGESMRGILLVIKTYQTQFYVMDFTANQKLILIN
jgi:hypothetical protein